MFWSHVNVANYLHVITPPRLSSNSVSGRLPCGATELQRDFEGDRSGVTRNDDNSSDLAQGRSSNLVYEEPLACLSQTNIMQMHLPVCA